METNINHTSRKHAFLSASGAERWLNCTPSAFLENKFESKTSVHAEEGTLAHEFGDLKLRHKLERISTKSYNTELRKLKAHKLYSAEIETEVDKYVDIVMEIYNDLKSSHKDVVILIEGRLDFSHVVEKGFGTGDVLIIADGAMNVIDLKFGKGVTVTAEDNSQLKLYALGALNLYGLSYEINKVILNIVQPRLDNFSQWEISVVDLERWANDVVKPASQKAYIGEGEQVAGSWCKFCRAKPVCRALAEESMKMAAYDFRDPQCLSDGEVLDVYNKLPVFTDWAKSVENYVLEQALQGKNWDGYKLVEGKSNRAWSDEEKVKEILSKDFKEKDYMVSKLIGIPAAEKLVGKEKLSGISHLIIKPQGKPTIVKDTDKRPSFGVEQAKEDFKD